VKKCEKSREELKNKKENFEKKYQQQSGASWEKRLHESMEEVTEVRKDLKTLDAGIESLKENVKALQESQKARKELKKAKKEYQDYGTPPVTPPRGNRRNASMNQDYDTPPSCSSSSSSTVSPAPVTTTFADLDPEIWD